MSVDTKKVKRQRQLRFDSYDDLSREVERLAAAREVKALGNWSLGQALKHLAIGMHMAIDGTDERGPFWLPYVFPLFKKSFLSKTLSPGFRLPKPMEARMVPNPATTTHEGLVAIRDAIRRMISESKRMPHAAFGKLSRAEWDQLTFRHAELHLSFLEPVE